jgi:transcriptional regulator GlxA family with amidase domain
MKKILVLLVICLQVAALTGRLSAQTKKAPAKKVQPQSNYYCPPCGNCDKTAYKVAGKCPVCGMTLVKQTVAEHNKNDKRLKVAFYLQDGVEVLDFAGPMEVFAYANFDVFTVSATKDQIKSQGILKITPEYSIDDAPHADILAFFGGEAVNNPKVIDWVKAQTNIDYYFSVCTGAFTLGDAGLLDNLTATTFHLSIDNLQKKLPKTKVLKNVRFVDNGKVITTAGISAGIDGALHLVEKIRGIETAKQIAAHIEYDKWVPQQGLVIAQAE